MLSKNRYIKLQTRDSDPDLVVYFFQVCTGKKVHPTRSGVYFFAKANLEIYTTGARGLCTDQAFALVTFCTVFNSKAINPNNT